MSAQEPGTWQELLGQWIADTKTRARLAAAIHIRSVTLQRWAEGVSKPRDENIRLLIKNIPKKMYPLFIRLLIIDFPGLAGEKLPEERFLQELPAEFYARALSNLALTPPVMYRQSMQSLVFQQALQHLDPDQSGLSITLVTCVPPRPGGKVHSLHEAGGLATPPWPRNPEEKPAFLGIETLIGYAVAQTRPYVINSRDERTFFPVQWEEHEKSAAAFPILRHAHVAGGLIISSAQEHFFTPPRLAVIEAYTHLAACIFEAKDVFDLSEIELRIMPPYERQRPYFASYNQRISRKLLEAQIQGQQLTWHQARQRVWQDLEDILLQVVLQSEVEH